MDFKGKILGITTLAKEGAVLVAGNAARGANRDGAGFNVAGDWRKVK
jgi:hypothetical protein